MSAWGMPPTAAVPLWIFAATSLEHRAVIHLCHPHAVLATASVDPACNHQACAGWEIVREQLRDLHYLDPSAGRYGVERAGELPGRSQIRNRRAVRSPRSIRGSAPAGLSTRRGEQPSTRPG